MTADKVKPLSISLRAQVWKTIDSLVGEGQRSDYFQRLVDLDLVKSTDGRVYSKMLGDPTAVPKIVEDRFEQRFSRIEDAVASNTQKVDAIAENVSMILRLEKHSLGRR